MPRTQQKVKKGIYLLLGENEVEKNEYIKRIVLDFSKGEDIQTITIDLYTDEEGLKTFSNHCNLKSLFGNRKVIILKINKTLNKQEKEIINSGVSSVDDDTLLIITSTSSPYKFDKSISLAIENKGGEVKTFWRVFENDLPAYVKNLLIKNNIEISEELTNFLIERNGNDPNGLYEDVNYIKNYFQTKNLIRSHEALETLFQKSGEGNIFSLVSSIVRGEKHKVLLLLNDIIDKGENLYALGLLIYKQVEKIVNVRKLSEKYLSDEEISKQLGLSTFEIKNTKKLVKEINNDTLRKLIKLATILEKNTRSTTTIKDLLLEKAIIELL